jgi:hypothetical protein
VNSAARRAGRDDPDEPGWTNRARARRYREALLKLDEIEVEGELERAAAQELLLLEMRRALPAVPLWLKIVAR